MEIYQGNSKCTALAQLQKAKKNRNNVQINSYKKIQKELQEKIQKEYNTATEAETKKVLEQLKKGKGRIRLYQRMQILQDYQLILYQYKPDI
eukprot:252969-Ditylum_brightwellii.AAC.1